ncbi:MAG: DNA photolyase family protein [Rhodospirillales bacterium]|nr:DNA photolyase family protein [Rhodospirillales bacterium]
MTASGPTILWFRQDLRLADNPALAAAVARGHPVMPLYILDDETPGPWRPGAAARWWLHHSLAALAEDLAAKGAPLVLQRGPAQDVLDEVVRESGAAAVYWNRCYEPFAVDRDTALQRDLRARGLEAQSFNAGLLHEPGSLKSGAGGPYKVFTPFWKALQAAPAPPPPARAPERIAAGRAEGERLCDWALLPGKPDWAGGLRQAWTPGEAGGRARLAAFLEHGLTDYGEARDRPGRPGTSRLSPHLHWGELGPRQVWHAALGRAAGRAELALPFLRQLAWREFSAHLLYHWPDLPEQPWRAAFAAFPWRGDDKGFRAWCRGRTGFPLVDAGMRELWATGWMHNRARMVAASFLVKHLLVPWHKGEAWFWDTLVDADLANNAASWQWVAGCGADAAPYFRIFNPARQSEKFDPAGDYLRRWLPELARLPDDHLHRPWAAPAEVLAEAGVELGRTYPKPLLDHAAARDRALAAYQAFRAEGT